MGGSVATAIEAVNPTGQVVPFTEEERRGIIRILSNAKYAPGARAGYLLRAHGEKLRFSPRAKLLYLLLAGFVGADPTRPERIAVSMRKLAAWANCTTRSAQSAIRELTRSGPLPLLLETPGRPGRVSEYQVVRDPFEVAAAQLAAAARTRTHRQPAYGKGQIQAFREGGAAELDRKLPILKKRQGWNLPTRAALPAPAAPPPSPPYSFAHVNTPNPRSGLRP